MESKNANWCAHHHQPYEQCPSICGYASVYLRKLHRQLERKALVEKRELDRLAKIIPCARCGKPHYSKRGGLYCSSRCKYEPVKKEVKPIAPCQACGAPVKKHSSKYCSRACWATSAHRKWECATCGKETASRRKYCSKQCRPRRPRAPKPIKVKECPQCHSQHTRKGNKYCSHKCSAQVDRKRRYAYKLHRQRLKSQAAKLAFTPQSRTCPHCKKKFTTTFHTPTKAYCSDRCSKRFKASRRRRENPQLKIKDALSGRLRELLRQKGLNKQSPTASYFGITPKELRSWLESQFTEGMSWANYGPFGWHIDHYIPCQQFDLSKEEHVKVCFNWRNLRPLWGKENTRRQHWLSVDERLFMSAELYKMTKAIGINV